MSALSEALETVRRPCIGEPGGPVVVAMSGGVDSSIAAALLVEAGWRVFGVTMRLWDYRRVGGNVRRERACCSEADFRDARSVAQTLGIPHYVMDFRRAFSDAVIANFVETYARGATPNPCVQCNTHVKWRALWERGRALGAHYLATGHYARVTRDTTTGAYALRRAVDRRKDQSYFLWGMGQAELASSLFPLGALTKDAVRTVAAELGLRTAGKPESQEICFVTDGDYRRFLSEHGAKTSPNWRPVQSGPILDPEGRQVGIHRGVPFYTVGQRRGLGVALGVPMYVTRIDAERNAVWVGPAEALATRSFSVGDVRWASGTPPDAPLRTTVQVRHRHPGAPVEVVPLESGAVHVRAERPERGVTPGQSAVFYAEDRVLGGGIIEAVKA